MALGRQSGYPSEAKVARCRGVVMDSSKSMEGAKEA